MRMLSFPCAFSVNEEAFTSWMREYSDGAFETLLHGGIRAYRILKEEPSEVIFSLREKRAYITASESSLLDLVAFLTQKAIKAERLPLTPTPIPLEESMVSYLADVMAFRENAERRVQPSQRGARHLQRNQGKLSLN